MDAAETEKTPFVNATLGFEVARAGEGVDWIPRPPRSTLDQQPHRFLPLRSDAVQQLTVRDDVISKLYHVNYEMIKLYHVHDK
jgi:hypothetical protein